VVQEAPPDVAQRYQHREPTEIFARGTEFVIKHEEQAVELEKAMRDRRDLSEDLSAAAAQGAAEASTSVLDERQGRRRSRTERHR
jgi:hypothetical protein